MERPLDGYTGLIGSEVCVLENIKSIRSAIEITDFDIICKIQIAAGKCTLYAECRRNPITPSQIDIYDTQGECVRNPAAGQQG